MSDTQQDDVSGQPQRSPHHFHHGGNLYVQAGNVLFKVYKELFLRRSLTMYKTLFDLRPNDAGLPGTTEHNPLHVKDSAEEFTLVLNAILGDPAEGVEIDEYREPPLPTISRAFMRLRVGTRWAIEPMRILAIYEIEALKEKELVDPVSMMMISVECSIYYWYRPAVRALLRTPELALTPDDLSLVDIDTLQCLLKWRDKIDKERIRATLSFPNPPPNPSCEQPDVCEDAALTCWTGIEDFARCPMADFAEDLAYRMEMSGLCVGCMEAWKLKISESGVLKKEEDMIEEAAAQMSAYCTNFD